MGGGSIYMWEKLVIESKCLSNQMSVSLLVSDQQKLNPFTFFDDKNIDLPVSACLSRKTDVVMLNNIIFNACMLKKNKLQVWRLKELLPLMNMWLKAQFKDKKFHF